MKVFKYILKSSRVPLKLPKGCKVLKAAFQGDNLCIWAEVNTVEEKEFRNFSVFATGEAMPYNPNTHYDYIDTVFTGPGLVFHVYERVENE